MDTSFFHLRESRVKRVRQRKKRRAKCVFPPLLLWALPVLALHVLGVSASSLSVELQREAHALLRFKSALVDSQKSTASWKLGISPCRWKHVTCDDAGRRVEKVDLYGAGLQGNLSKEITNLRHLKYLSLGANQFIGFIPPEIAKLTGLQYLDLSANLLEETIPPELASLRFLTYLDLSQNALKGSFPEGICSIPHLQYLNFNTNDIGGYLPSDFFQMKEIEYLDLAFNSITGTISPEFSEFSSLKHLDLTSNNFSGTIPSSLGHLPLEVLNLGMNHFTGPVPDEIARISTLYALRLSFNSFTGEISPLYGDLPNLTFFHVTSNEFHGSIPPELGNPPLIELLLGYNNLTGSIPTAMFENLADTLQLLELSFNQLTGEVPLELTRLKYIKSIDISNNFLTGSIPSGFGSIPDLVLALGYNELTGTIPDDLISSDKIFYLSLNRTYIEGTLPEFNCSNLFSLELAGNRLRGDLPPFGHCHLNELHLQGNNFTGKIPSLPASISVLNLQENRLSGILPDFTYFKSLNTVNICCNELRGSIPASLTRLPSLVFLDISDNLLEGHLPVSLFDMPELLFINASYNRFTGGLPSDFKCSKITSIFLRGNALEGYIPSSFFKLQYVQYLDFRDNRFSGPIPSQFSRLQYLVSLFLSGNAFNDSLPSSFSKLNTLRVLDASNNSLSGSLPPDISGWSLSLTKLKLSHNSITGKIPTQYGGLIRLKELDLSSNNLQGKLPSELGKLRNIVSFNVSRNQLSGEIPIKLGSLSALEFLDLSSNNLDGMIPHHLGDLRHLKALILSDNNLTGQIDEYILEIPTLDHLNASYNHLQGFVGQKYVEKFGKSAFEHNLGLCGTAFDLQCSNPTPGNDNGKGPWSISRILIVLCAVLFFLFFSALGIRLRILRLRRKLGQDFGEVKLFDKLECSVKVQDIILATDGFSKKHMVGAGGFGEVYRAFLPDGKTEVAVKRLMNSGQQGEKEFLSEMQTLGGIRHRHLVRLIGAYSDPSGLDRFLIYDYMPGGSLDVLFEPNNSQCDPRLRLWETRLNIALGVARGLKYLHHDCKPRIIHRDLKPSNILLDKDLTPRISDFGLARTMNNPSITHLSTAACGTVGYMSLEYARKGKATEKSDVYAYGIILLQLVTGKRPTDETFAYEGLRLWVATNPTFGVVDWKLESAEGCMQQILGMLRLGLLCSSDSPSERPSMIEVLHVLQNLKEFASGIELKEMNDDNNSNKGDRGSLSVRNGDEDEEDDRCYVITSDSSSSM